MTDASDNPRVSAIVTTHNRAAMLPRAVESVLAQTYDDYELIIVDDCSTDDTPEVVRAFEDSRIRAVRHPENLGHSSAVNTGIRMARGEYVAFLDDDDEWTETKLSRQVDVLDVSGPRVGLAYTWFDHVDTPDGLRSPGGRSVATGALTEEMLGCRVPAPTSTYLVRTQAAREIGGFNEALNLVTDLDFLARLTTKWQVAVVPEVLVVMHTGHARSRQRPDAFETLARYVKTHICRFDRELRERPAVFARLLRFLAIAELRRGNLRGAAAAYRRALATDTRDTLRATVTNVGFVVGLLWGRIRRRRR